MDQASPTTSRIFKDWVMPGPPAKRRGGETPQADLTAEITAQEITLDALSGLWRIYQYKTGHRYSTDDVLTAWYGTTECPSPARVLDLGSGIGSVGMMAAWRLPGSEFVTIEAQNISVRLARESAKYNGIEHRYKILEGDLRDMDPGEGRFDLVLGSPPYFPLGTGVESEHPQALACRFELRGGVSNYAEAAAKHLAPGGMFACVFPTNQLDRVACAASENGLTIVSRRDVVFREGDAPLISLFAMSRTTDLPPAFVAQTFVETPLIVRLKNGEVHPEYKTVKLTMGFRP